MSCNYPPCNSLYSLFERSAKTYGSAPAMTLIEQLEPLREYSVSYQQLFDQLNRTIRLLRELSGKTHPVVTLLLPNVIQGQYLLWGAACAGIANPLNPLLNVQTLSSLMEAADTDIIVALGPVPGSDIWQKTQQAAARLAKQPPLVSCMLPAGAYHYEALLAQYNAQPLPIHEQPKPGDLAAYFHTGGTTGAPKLACHSHANQLAAAHAYQRSMQLGPGDSILNGLPLFHVAGSLAVALGTLACGVHMLLPTPTGLRNPDVVKAHWRLVEHYRLTVSGGIPTSVAAMLQVPVGDHDIRSLRYLISGGAMVPAALCEQVREHTGRELYQIYGMTECTGVITMPNLAMPSIPGSAGFVSGEIEVKIDGSPNGEILVRGPTLFTGYLGQAAPTLDDGWLRTGDLGYLDEHGNLFITGRAKDVIIRSGHNIDPQMIEAAMELHPDVMLAAAVGMPDSYAGELPCVFVQLRQGSQCSIEQLLAHAQDHIAERPAFPKQVFILDSLPITAVGKIYKVRLRELAAEYVYGQCLAECYPQPAFNIQQHADGRLYLQLEQGDDTQQHQWCLAQAQALNLSPVCA